MSYTYRVTLNGHIGGGINKPIVNVFGYDDPAVVQVNPATLGAVFMAAVLPTLLDCVSDGYVVDNTLVEQVVGGTFFNLTAPPLDHVGHRTGDQLPLFNAWGFSYNRAALGQRSGSKRFSIITETDQNQGNPSAGILVNLNSLGVALGTPLQFETVDAWYPVILERPKFPGGPWGKHGISSVSFTRVTTQSSRKINR